jgi:hypothetical protein
MAQENDDCQVFTLNENKTPAKRSCHDTLILVLIQKEKKYLPLEYFIIFRFYLVFLLASIQC